MATMQRPKLQHGGFVEEMVKAATGSKALVIKINVAFLSFFLVVYLVVLFQPASFYDEAASLVRCSLRECRLKKDEDYGIITSRVAREKRIARETIPSFLTSTLTLRGNSRIGLVNAGGDQADLWRDMGYAVELVRFDRVSANFEWKHLFPEWVDEEEDDEGPSCPDLPLPDLSAHGEVDVVVAAIPCRRPEAGWGRDVARLQVHLVAANLAARKGRRSGEGNLGKVRVVVNSKCQPMIEIFRCDDLVRHEGDWWLYELDARRLEEKVSLPMGSCKLALPLWREGAIQDRYDYSPLKYPSATTSRREAYATVIHSSDKYVCGALALAQSLLKTKTDRDLVLLHDKSIPADKLRALSAAGWTLQLINRIRNPRAEKGSYNEYNYSKLRLWQLTRYSKVVFVDSDIVVLRNLDHLFHFPQLSATGNDGVIFNSGIMVLEPSQCAFETLIRRRHEIVSYNGGDQGFLNEAFVWWHRLPRRVNFLKNFWANTTVERAMKEHLFSSEPPELYSIHFLGLKPWLCYRDYDCNWDIADQRVYASDAAHWRWWRVHDDMDEGLKAFCGLTEQRKVELEWDRKLAGEAGLADRHWSINVTDQRRLG